CFRRASEKGASSARRRRCAGFTLVELLVVIGVLATVMALLLPTIRGVREQAQRTVCASRLRNLAAAAVNYAVENHGVLPSGARGGSIPVAFGAAGGNGAFLDGSVRWKQVGRPAVGNAPTGPFNKFGEMLWYYTYSYPNATTADHSYVGLW